MAKPGESSLDHPASRQDLNPFLMGRALEDFERPAQDSVDPSREGLASKSTVCLNLLQTAPGGGEPNRAVFSLEREHPNLSDRDYGDRSLID